MSQARPLPLCEADLSGQRPSLEEYIAALKASERFACQISHHEILPEVPARHGMPRRAWSRAVSEVLEQAGIANLYLHQCAATDRIRAGKHVVTATPTASGKSLIYNLPVIERFLTDREATALYLFPLKALAQDQAAAFTALTAHWPEAARPRIAIYDGDTSDHFRKKIRKDPPQVLITNPEMLHLAILPFHHQWTTFLASLSTVVVDEVHTYRGVMGSHMAQVFRRLKRIAALYGASPQFISCSATIGNPAELAELLTGEAPETVLESGAPQGKRHFVFINPEDSPATTAINLLRAALPRGLRTIVYAQSRRMTELISLWAAEQAGPYASRISAYRAGFLPEERRGIEERMASGDLLAVISTSALELGIDIGNLDLCILVGYPGTVMSTLQRGGRVGRSSQESAVVLIAGEDALDQYIVRHGRDFFRRPPEKAVLNPENPVIFERHLECAAAEQALKPEGRDKAWLGSETAKACIASLEAQGLLLRTADGTTLLAARKRPQRLVDLRGAGHTLVIQDEGGKAIGTVDAVRAMKEAHPGAVYLHRGRSYVVDTLDLSGRTVRVKPGKPNYYTRSRGNKTTEVLSLDQHRVVGCSRVHLGRLRVTETITGYEKRASTDGRLLGIVPLEYPPQVFETEGIWFDVPDPAREAVEENLLHFMGAIHALEHAAIGILPLLVMTDRNDLGGISTPMHPQVGKPAVFIYDGLPGGAGLTRQAFEQAEELFARTLDVIRLCDCETGCPSCVHSPKCGSGNRPIDKAGALFLMEDLVRQGERSDEVMRVPPPAPAGQDPVSDSGLHFRDLRRTDEADGLGFSQDTGLVVGREVKIVGSAIPAGVPGASAASQPEPALGNTSASGASAPFALDRSSLPGQDRAVPLSAAVVTVPDGSAVREIPLAPVGRPAPPARFAVLDVETRYSAQQVGGWHRASRMGVSVAVLYDSGDDSFTAYQQHELPCMMDRLSACDLIVGFNILRFDYAVLDPHLPGVILRNLPTLDMLAKVHERLSYRLSLDNLARSTLNTPKSADGLQALEWWKNGEVDKIREYCQQDVAVTRDLYLYGREHGFLLFTNKAGQRVRVPVSW